MVRGMLTFATPASGPMVCFEPVLLPCRCDAQAKPCIVIEQGFGTDALDTVMVDVSTLRCTDATQVCAESSSAPMSTVSQHTLL